VQRTRANERWLSDAISLTWWNSELVEIACAHDCGDRECLAWVASTDALTGTDFRRLAAEAIRHRFGVERPPHPIQWLSDSGSIYTALETVVALQDLGLTPITTPVCGRESNGISEAFHHTLRGDYVAGADLSSVDGVLAQLPQCVADYNHFAPHSSLGMRNPIEYRRAQEIAADYASECLIYWGPLHRSNRDM
jgi:transposase InsO family protein